MRSGPAPDPQALRRERDGHEWVRLPSGGLQEAPRWPLKGQSDREVELWSALWLEKPQAHEWARLGLEVEVGLYVRKLTEAEGLESSAATATLVRQFMDSLGLTVGGLQRNKWRITGEDVKPQKTQRARQRRASSSRDRLRVVPPS